MKMVLINFEIQKINTMKHKLLLFSLATLIFASCSTTLERKAPVYGGSWSSEAKKITTNQSKSSSENRNELSENSELIAEPTIEGEVNSQTESIGLTAIHESKNQSTNSVKKTVIIKNQLQTKLIQPVVSKFVKKINNVKVKSKALSNSGDGGMGFSIAALVLGIIGLFVLPWLLGPLAIIFGALGLNRGGRGMAIAGLVLGVIDLVLWVLFLFILVSTL
jgi:hypothetical protein